MWKPNNVLYFKTIILFSLSFCELKVNLGSTLVNLTGINLTEIENE